MSATVEQARAALDRANEIRRYRSRVKRELRAGELHAADVIRDERLATMEVDTLIDALPGFGRVKVRAALRVAGVRAGRKVGELTERQIDALLEQVEQ